jgi:creatinine amidohydrolase
MKRHLISEMTWPEVEEIVKQTDMIVLPVGTNENNGPHLPMSLDSIVASEMALKLARETDLPVAPLIPVGNSDLFARYPGTIVIRIEVLAELYKDICMSLAYHGFRRFLVITPHMPNLYAINAAGEAMKREGCFMATMDWWRVQNNLCADLAKSPAYATGHASELGTAILMALRPDLLRKDKMKAEFPTNPFYVKRSKEAGMLVLYNDMKMYSESGVVGDPTQATVEQGEEIIRRCMKYAVELVNDIKAVELPLKR